jgi:sialate O-acetylesterase
VTSTTDTGAAIRRGDTVTDHVTLQRDARDRGTLRHTWSIPFDASARTEVSVRRDGRDVDVEVADEGSNDGRQTSVVSGLPTGGPYDIKLAVTDSSSRPVASHHVTGVQVGDIWVLAGQSNMATSQPDQGVEPPPGITFLGFDRRWQPGLEPFHRAWLAADGVYERILRDTPLPSEQVDSYFAAPQPPHTDEPASGGSVAGFFARELYAMTGVPIGLIPCALGGASLEQWSPDFARAKGWPDEDGLFGNMLSLVAQAGGRVRGVLWYQGESDAFLHVSDTYLERFRQFVADVRGALDDDALPFVTVQIAGVDPWDPECAPWLELQREHQRQATTTLTNVTMVAAADLPRCDESHLDFEGQRRIGRRLARAATQFVPGATEILQVPTLRSAVVSEDGRTVEIGVDGIVGSLRLTNEPSVATCFRVEDNEVLDAEINDDTVMLHLARPVESQHRLTYGPGNRPPVGLVDDEDMALPCWGPVTISTITSR